MYSTSAAANTRALLAGMHLHELQMAALVHSNGMVNSLSTPWAQAIMDVTQNQMNITKYANNPEIMAVFNKMSTLFTPK